MNDASASPGPSSPLQTAPSRRTKISCFPCRTRKSKCDHARPCSSCVLRGTEQQCADPNGAAPPSAMPASSNSETSTPAHPPAKPRSLPSSASMPVLGPTDHASNQTLREQDSSSGSRHPKRRRTEAAAPRFDTASASVADPSHAGPDPEQDIQQQVNQMKHSLARLEDLLGHRADHRLQLSLDPFAGPTAPSQVSSSDPPPTPSATTREYTLDLQEDCPGELDPPSKESRKRWHTLRFLLPPLIDTHMIMNHLFVEADWLMPWIDAPRFVARWRHAYERQAISDVFAVQVLGVVGCAALLLSDNRQRTIQCAVPVRSLHIKLLKEALTIVDAMPAIRSGRSEAETCDMLELMLTIAFYFRCIGKEALMSRYVERASAHALRVGYDNELRPCWLSLNHHQIERRRVLMMEVVLVTKWLAFHCRRELAHVRVQSFNVGRPHLDNVGQLPPLSAWPESDSLARAIHAQASSSNTAAAASRYLPWRAKAEEERNVARKYSIIGSSFSSELPALVDLVTKAEARLLQPDALARCTKEDMRDMARQTRQILARLNEWFDVFLPQAGLGFERIFNSDPTTADPVEAKRLATILMFNHAFLYKTSILCRPWLLLSDRLQSLDDLHRDDDYEHLAKVDQNFFAQFKQRSIDHVHHLHASWLPPTFLADIEAVVLENARRCIRTIPVIRTLQAQISSQFYVSWTSQSSMQAAVNLAIPLVRSHHRHAQSSYAQPETSVRLSATSPQRSDAEPGSTAPTTDDMRRDLVTIFEAVSQLSDKVMARRAALVLKRAMHFSGIDQPMGRGEEDDDAADVWETEEGSGQMQKAAEGLALLSAASASSSARTPPDSITSRHSSSGHGSPAYAARAWESTSRSTVNQPAQDGRVKASPDAPFSQMGGSGSANQSHVHLWQSVAPAQPNASGAESASMPAPSTGEAMARQPMWWEARLPTNAQPPAADSAASGHGGFGSRAEAGATGGGQTYMSDSQLLDELLNFDASFWQFVVEGTDVAVAS